MSMRPTGKKTKAVTNVMVSPMDPETKTSPLIAPLAAKPCVNRKRKPLATSKAP